MNWTEFQDAIGAEVATITGLRAAWRDQQRPLLSDDTQAIAVLHVATERTLWRHVVDLPGAADGDLSTEIHAVKRIEVAIAIESLVATHARAAAGRLSTLRDGLYERRIPGIALVLASDGTDAEQTFDDHAVSAATMTAVFSADIVHDGTSAPTWFEPIVPWISTVVIARGRAFSGAFAVGFD